MLLKQAISIALIIAAASPSIATTQPASAAVDDKQVEMFLSALKTGHGKEAVQAVMSSSPLWAKHPGFNEQMNGQIDAALQAYGPVTGFEKLSSTKLGSMAVREYYLVQHRDMVTRWEFDLVRTESGWSMGYFGFNDQLTSWF